MSRCRGLFGLESGPVLILKCGKAPVLLSGPGHPYSAALKGLLQMVKKKIKKIKQHAVVAFFFLSFFKFFFFNKSQTVIETAQGQSVLRLPSESCIP